MCVLCDSWSGQVDKINQARPSLRCLPPESRAPPPAEPVTHAHNPPSLTACNCNGHSSECTFDRELFRSTGHGGHCHHCRDHTAGPHCERCERNYYRWAPRTPCQPCDCHPAGEWPSIPFPHLPCSAPPASTALCPSSPGSLSLQCDNSGTCTCKPTVTGWKCDRCRPGFHSLSEGGCR